MFFIQLTEISYNDGFDPREIWVNVEAIAYFGIYFNKTLIYFHSTEHINVAETPKQILDRIPGDYK